MPLFKTTFLLLLFTVTAPNAAEALTPDEPINCKQCYAWNRPQEPFRVFGNTYYVGTTQLSSILIVTRDGFILLDGALPQSAPLIDANMRALGFNPGDIRLILTTHTHYDHVGGIAAFQRASGATVAASASSAKALQSGRPTPDDPQFASRENGFPKVSGVRVIQDGEVLTVGDVKVTAHFTPGHTPGGTSWTWRSCEKERCLNVVYADSLNAVSSDGFRFTGSSSNPSLVDTFRRSIRTVETLPCDLFFSPHPALFEFERRSQRYPRPPGVDGFLDPNACRDYAAAAAARLDQRIEEEKRAQR